MKILGLDESRITTALDKKERQYDEERGWYITYISYFSEKYMKIRCSLYEKKPGASNSIMIHVGDLPGDDWIERSLERFSVVFCLEPRGRGQNRLEPGAWFYTGDEIQNEEASYNCNADMLGRSVLGMMVHDVLSLQKIDFGAIWKGCRTGYLWQRRRCNNSLVCCPDRRHQECRVEPPSLLRQMLYR